VGFSDLFGLAFCVLIDEINNHMSFEEIKSSISETLGIMHGKNQGEREARLIEGEHPAPMITLEVSDNETNALDSARRDLVGAVQKHFATSDTEYKILLPVGRAAELMFADAASLVQELQETGADINKIIFIEGEGLWPLAKDHPAAFQTKMENGLIQAGVPRDNIICFDTEAENVELAYAPVKEAVKGGIDYAILGLNDSGAVAGLRDSKEYEGDNSAVTQFNIDNLPTRAEIDFAGLPGVDLKTAVGKMVDKHGFTPGTEPKYFFGAGWDTMSQAKNFALLATGESKKPAVEMLLPTLGTAVRVENGDEKKDWKMPRGADQIFSSAEVLLTRAQANLSSKVYLDYLPDQFEK